MIGGALFFYKTIQPPWRARENHTTAPLARGNAPLLPPAAASSPEGQICSMLSLVLTLVAHWIAPLELPPPGEVPPKAGIGVHFHRAPARFACFPFTRQGGCKGFIIRGAHLFLKAPTTTLGPEGRCPPFYTTLLHNLRRSRAPFLYLIHLSCLSDYMTREAKGPGECLSNPCGAQSMEVGRRETEPS